MEDLFAKKRPAYPWQLELPAWTLGAKLTEAERHVDFARHSFDFWKTLLDEGRGSHPLLFWDEGCGFFRAWETGGRGSAVKGDGWKRIYSGRSCRRYRG